MQASDIYLLLGLLRHPGGWTVRSLAQELRLPPAAVQRSLARLAQTPAYSESRRGVDRTAVEELLRHAIPFVAPAQLGGPARGVPTAWASPVLAEQFAASDEPSPVWPSPTGGTRGLAVEPLHPAAVELARSDPWMYAMLALVDGIRIGDARTRGVARGLLDARLAEVEAAA